MSFFDKPYIVHGAAEKNTLVTSEIHGKRIVAYATLDHVTVLNEHQQHFKTLHFADGYPSSSGKDWRITALCMDPIRHQMAAACGDHVVVWLAYTKRNWKIHSTLRTGHPISSLQLRNGRLIAAGTKMSLWTNDLERPIWTKTFESQEFERVDHLRSTSCGTYLASATEKGNLVRIWKCHAVGFELVSELWHPRPVVSFSWRSDPQSANHILYTQTSNGLFRLYSTIIDEPDYFVLFLTVSHPYTASRPRASFLLDSSLIKMSDQDSDTNDVVLTIFRDGTIGIVELLNLDRTPPTCFMQRPIHFHARMNLSKAPLGKLSPRTCISWTTAESLICEEPSINLLSSFEDGFLFVSLPLDVCWNPDPTSALWRQTAHRPSSGIHFATCSRDGRLLATLTSERTSIWSIRYLNGLPLRLELLASSKDLLAFNCAIYDNRIALLSNSGTLCLATWHDGAITLVNDMRIDTSTIRHIHWYDGRLLTSSDASIFLWTADLSKIATSIDSIYPIINLIELPEPFCVLRNASGSTISKVRIDGSLSDYAQVIHDEASLSVFDGDRQLAIYTASGQLQIWDTTTSEFSSGLELVVTLASTPLSLVWQAVPDAESLLMVHFDDRVDIYMQQRKDYFVLTDKWRLLTSLSSQSFSIRRALWLPDLSIITIEGTQIYLHPSTERFLRLSRSSTEPLPAYHPQFLEQCLLANHLPLVDSLVSYLSSHLHVLENDVLQQRLFNICLDSQRPHATSGEEESEAQMLLERILSHKYFTDLTQLEVSHLQVLLQTLIEVHKQRRALDENGMRYLVAMRTFFIHNESQMHLPKVKLDEHGPRLRYRDMLWAFFSESQELLVQDCHKACEHKLSWPMARSMGMFLWLTSHKSLVDLMDSIARVTFAQPSTADRDPITVSLFYLALKRKRLVQSIWKQSTQHPDRPAMLKFLANDFEEQRWKTAAAKNAFALLTKQRYLFAASFFLLADKLRDALNVIIRHLKDFQLAIAICRVYDASGITLKLILEESILPDAIAKGHRRLASWTLWLLDRRDLAVRALVIPFNELKQSLPSSVTTVGVAESEDPSLLLLYSQLRDWSLQTIKGAAKISAKTEFNFVSFMANLYREMGCHVLALDLAKSWKFSAAGASSSAKQVDLADLDKALSQVVLDGKEQRRAFAVRRRSSLLGRANHGIKMDMDIIPSQIHSRAASPPPERNGMHVHDYNTKMKDASADPLANDVFRKAKKATTAVPEFDMNAFNF